MEALALGSRKVPGGSCVGVTVSSDLPVPSNPYMTESVNATLSYITDENKRAKKPIFVARHPWEAIWKSICENLNVLFIPFYVS